MAKIQFTYSRSSRPGTGSVMQLHDQKHVVDIDDDRIAPDSLREAERSFVEWFAENFPYYYLISWTGRAARGLSQEALAHECGINRTYLSGVERSERNVSIDNIARIAKGLRVEPWMLLKDALSFWRSRGGHTWRATGAILGKTQVSPVVFVLRTRTPHVHRATSFMGCSAAETSSLPRAPDQPKIVA